MGHSGMNEGTGKTGGTAASDSMTPVDTPPTAGSAETHDTPRSPERDRAASDSERRGNPRRRGRWAARAPFIAVGLIAIAIAAFLGLRPRDGRTGGATLGTYEDKTLEEIKAELDRKVKDSMMTVSLDITPELSKDGGSLEVRVQNVEGNKFNQRIEVEQGGEPVGAFGSLRPGEKLDEIEVDGCREGPATVTITPLDRRTDKPDGNPASFEVEVHRAPE